MHWIYVLIGTRKKLHQFMKLGKLKLQYLQFGAICLNSINYKKTAFEKNEKPGFPNIMPFHLIIRYSIWFVQPTL